MKLISRSQMFSLPIFLTGLTLAYTVIALVSANFVF